VSRLLYREDMDGGREHLLGSGAELLAHPRWWPHYRRTVEAGKKVFIGIGGAEDIETLKREFGPRLKQFLLAVGAPSREKGEELLRIASD